MGSLGKSSFFERESVLTKKSGLSKKKNLFPSRNYLDFGVGDDEGLWGVMPRGNSLRVRPLKWEAVDILVVWWYQFTCNVTGSYGTLKWAGPLGRKFSFFALPILRGKSRNKYSNYIHY